MYLTIKESKEGRILLRNYLIELFTPRHKYTGFENRRKMDDIITLSTKFLEDKKYIPQTQKIDPKYRRLTYKEVHEMVSGILYGDLMNTDKKKKKWFLQGLLPNKIGKYSSFYYPKNDEEWEEIKAKQENKLESLKKSIHTRIDIEAKKYLEALPEREDQPKLDDGKDREVA